jgi:hypothetical protein
MTEPAKKAASIEHYVTGEQLGEDLTINPANLSEAMVKQASLFAHYAVLASRAQRQLDHMKQRLEILQSKVDKEIRDEAADEGRKITEAGIGKEIARDSRVITATKQVNEARMIADLAKQSLEAFKQRRDMLVQIGLMQREEMKGELTVGIKREKERAAGEAGSRLVEKLGSR